MLDDKLRVIKEEEDYRIKLGRKYVLAFSIINVVATLLSWLFTIYNWPLVIISLLLSIALYFFSITKFLWLVNSLYRAYFYLAVIFAMINQDFEFVWPSIENEIISEVGTCQGLRSQIAILSNGDVVPCCLDQDAEIKLGNIFEENLNDILEKKLTNEIIKGFENHKVIHNLCKRCGFRCKFDK